VRVVASVLYRPLAAIRVVLIVEIEAVLRDFQEYKLLRAKA
jgi:hypothetical protein